MRSHKALCFLTAIALFMGASGDRAVADENVGMLVVQVQGLNSDEGDLRFVIFDSKKIPGL